MEKRVTSLQYEVVFKKAFSQVPIFKGFVRDFLGIDLNIDRVETEKRFMEAVGPVRSKFDLFAEDVKQRIIVEIQHNYFDDHYDRFLYYHCTAIAEQARNSNNYKIDRQVYTIVVLTSGDRRCKEDWLESDFQLRSREGKAYSYLQHKLIFLSPKNLKNSTPEPYYSWLAAIADTLDQRVETSNYTNEIIQQIFDIIAEDGLTPEERAQLKDEYNWQQLSIANYERGEANALKKVAVGMLQSAIPLEQIAFYTGLSVTELQLLSTEKPE